MSFRSILRAFAQFAARRLPLLVAQALYEALRKRCRVKRGKARP